MYRDQDEDWKSKDYVFMDEKYSRKDRSGFQLRSEIDLVLLHTSAATWCGKLGADTRSRETNLGDIYHRILKIY